MKTKFALRSGAAIGALVSSFIAPCASAESAIDAGPVTVTVGGFTAAESAYRQRSETADIGSSFSGIPFSNSSMAHVSEFRTSARQSRLSVMMQANANPDTHLTFYGEFDFLGAAQTANSNESNSYNLRIRHFYGQVDWDREGVDLLAGQTWSLATMNGHGITARNEVIPATIDAQYSVGFVWQRTPQIRVVKNWDHQVWLALSVENPQTTFASGAAPGMGGAATTASPGITVIDNNAGGSLFDKTDNFSLNRMPDIVGKAAWEPLFGDSQPLHLEVFGVYRSFYDRISIAATNALNLQPGVRNANTSGYGIGGGITYNAIAKLLDLQASALTGSGIGRYGSGQLPDVALNANGALAPLRETMVLLGATLHAMPTLDLYLYAGREAEQAKLFTVGNRVSGIGNPALNTADCFVEGGSCPANLHAESQISMGAWWRAYQGHYGSLRLGVQYSYTHLTDFAGVGGKPTTDDNMFFTSIRYYPF